MPATAVRPHPTEQLLCGHLYRVSCQVLASASATVTELVGPEGQLPEALLAGVLPPGQHGPSGRPV